LTDAKRHKPNYCADGGEGGQPAIIRFSLCLVAMAAVPGICQPEFFLKHRLRFEHFSGIFRANFRPTANL